MWVKAQWLFRGLQEDPYMSFTWRRDPVTHGRVYLVSVVGSNERMGLSWFKNEAGPSMFKRLCDTGSHMNQSEETTQIHTGVQHRGKVKMHQTPSCARELLVWLETYGDVDTCKNQWYSEANQGQVSKRVAAT